MNIDVKKALTFEIENPLNGESAALYREEFNTDFLLEDVDLEDYGQEVYNQFFKKTNQQMRQDYLTSLRVQHLDDGTPDCLVVSIFQCLLEVVAIFKHIIVQDFTGKQECLEASLLRAGELVFRRRFKPMLQEKFDISFLTKKL